jgi:hypothetical protein
MNTLTRPSGESPSEPRDHRSSIPGKRSFDVATEPTRPGSDEPAAAIHVATDDAETRTARHRRECPSRCSRDRTAAEAAAVTRSHHERRAQARQSANADAPQRVIESAHSVQRSTGPADVAADETEIRIRASSLCRTTTSIETVVRAGASPSSGGGMRTRVPAHSLQNRRHGSDQRPNARRARAVLPPRGYTLSAETVLTNRRIAPMDGERCIEATTGMPRRTRNDVATASTSPRVLVHTKRGPTTRRVSEWTEAHPRQRRIARPGLQALARSLLRASSRRELQALRDDHEPEGPRHQTPRPMRWVANVESRSPEALRHWRVQDTPATPRQTSRRTEIRQPDRSGASEPLRCRHRRGACPRHNRDEGNHDLECVHVSVPSDRCSRQHRPKPTLPSTLVAGRGARQHPRSVQRDR